MHLFDAERRVAEHKAHADFGGKVVLLEVFPHDIAQKPAPVRGDGELL